jgi:predicted extracellular nuclease
MKYQNFSRKTCSIFLALVLCLSWLPASTINAQAVATNIDLLLLSNPNGIGNAAPAGVFAGENSLLTVTVTPGSDPASTGITVAADLTAIDGSATQTFFDDATNGDVTASDKVFSFLATVPTGTSAGLKTLPATITDEEDRTGSATINLVVKPPLVAIHTIQGASHISPLNGLFETTQGIVIALRSNGFYMQDPNPDADEATSEGIFVFTRSAPVVLVGDLVEVVGTVTEFRPGGAGGTNNLTTTELADLGLLVTVLSSGNSLPAATVIGTGGRVPPSFAIEDDATGDVESSGIFDPATDGIDFFESLEGMYVQVNSAVAVGPTSSFGELPVLGDNGANAAPGIRTTRGGIVIQPDNFNPERIILDDEILLLNSKSMPFANVNDKISGSVSGVIDYSFGNFKLEVLQPPVLTSGGLVKEVAPPATAYQLVVATFNVENLAPSDPAAKFTTLATQIVSNLGSPDILAIEEIQDNNGTQDTGVVDASTTWSMLIAAIQAAGGPTYQYRQIDPVDNQDGGAPGSNIRQGFLFRTDRGLAFVDHAGGTATDANSVTGTGSSTELTYSPGRVDPTNAAFNASRKPLAGEFTFKGDKVFVLANHFNSKSGDQPLFGHFQPPVLSSEAQRLQQAQVVHDFAAAILAADPNANVVVLGDLNDFQFSNPVVTLAGSLLNDLVNSLPEAERYTYVYEGNSETLDHILLGNPTFGRPFTYDIVHVNSEFAVQASDHDPQVSLICVDATPPTLTLSVSPDVLWPPNHKYVTVEATVSVKDKADPNASWSLVSVTSNEPDNGIGDGNTTNDILVINDTTFQLRAERSGSGNGRVYSFAYQATDACGNTATANTAVYVPHDMGKLKDLQTEFPPAASLPAAVRYFLYPKVNLVQFFFLPLITR